MRIVIIKMDLRSFVVSGEFEFDVKYLFWYCMEANDGKKWRIDSSGLKNTFGLEAYHFHRSPIQFSTIPS